jgi:hypothetical protein
MKPPSRSIGASLRSQRAAPPRGQEKIEISRQKAGGPSMIVPGEGNVEGEPGFQHLRSAQKYVEPMSRFGGRGGGRN